MSSDKGGKGLKKKLGSFLNLGRREVISALYELVEQRDRAGGAVRPGRRQRMGVPFGRRQRGRSMGVPFGRGCPFGRGWSMGVLLGGGRVIGLSRLEGLVVALWEERRAGGAGGSAMQRMRAMFREEGLRPRQQKRVKALYYQWLSREAMVEYAVEVGAPGGIIPVLAGPVRLLASRVLSGDLSPREAAAKVPWMDWERVRGVPVEVRGMEDVPRRLELLGSIPPWLARRLWEVLGEEAQPCLEGLMGRPRVTLRANLLWGDRERLAQALAEEGISTRPTEFASQGLLLERPAQLLRTKAYGRGAFELQDEASQLVAELVAPPKGGLVLDACAGAGGKALSLAGMVGPGGRVVALDNSASRLADLRRRARRAGASHVEGFRVPADSWPPRIVELARRADRILVDAPCSGLGSLRRNPDLRARIDPNELRRLRGIQVSLLERAGRVLAPGAQLIYATCTFLPEENAEVVAEVCARIPELELLPVAEVLGDGGAGEKPLSFLRAGEQALPFLCEGGRFFQTLPHRHGMDGFFAAVLRRRNPGEAG
ncbi:MAG TPA: RsmB/NOP family class I SAM-dependent RNA methyltransferase [Planctomycetes bacterium]|nr:RsmB/NOP family class I SAM-dependent RNA methyltransferase [Planctomycetota bacterium]